VRPHLFTHAGIEFGERRVEPAELLEQGRE
jgi:hypothetical protein